MRDNRDPEQIGRALLASARTLRMKIPDLTLSQVQDHLIRIGNTEAGGALPLSSGLMRNGNVEPRGEGVVESGDDAS